MSVACLPELGSKPVSLAVKLKSKVASSPQDELDVGLQGLYRKGELTDVALLCCEQRFRAHRVVLASRSPFFKENLAKPPPDSLEHEIRLDVPNPEAVKIMLDFMYALDENDWAKFNPRTQAINRDVLQLAKTVQLPDLTDQAMHWLGKDITTGNVVERLAMCDEFGLSQLKEKILQQLAYNKEALAEVSHSAQIVQYPQLMQALLQVQATFPEEPKSKKRKA